MRNVPHHAGWAIAIAAFVAIVTLAVNFVLHVSAPSIDQLARVYEIPPTFGGHRWLYGTVLALLLSMAFLSMGAALENVRAMLQIRAGWHEPAKVYLLNETVLLVSIVFAILPDAIVLLAWGEASAPANSTLYKGDRIFDAVSAFTFLVYLWRRVRVRPVIIHQLLREPIPVELTPTWAQLRPKVLIAVGIIIVSFGVAFGK